LLRCMNPEVALRDISHRDASSVANGGIAEIDRPTPIAEGDARDPHVWSGRAVQEVSSIWQYGLASMYPVSPWSSFAPDHHGYQRACDIFSGQASTGPFGSPVFACAGKTDPPSSSHPLADLGGGVVDYVIDSLLLTSWLFLCSRLAAVPSSRPARAECAARKGRQGWPVALALPPRFRAARPRLDGPRARREDHAGRDAIASVLTNSKARPLLRTAHAMRASLLASAMASTLWCSRFLAASIQDLSP